MAIAVSGAAVSYLASRPEPAPTITTAEVTRGDVVETVDATGALQAVTTVQVGTQVSGTIEALHADFNSRVRRGQVIAELEPSLFEAQVEQARASLARLEADAARVSVQLDDARQKLRRARELADRQLISASDFETAEMNARQAEAAVKAAQAQIVQARASLNQSEVNLAHTIIRAPIDGIVVSRNVDVGQTVAASMQAPTLFVIARDLREMQVNASIAESDIGRIQPGQPVSFTVDAYPGEVFSGLVSQVRLQPVVEQNVVSYITIIEAPNPDLRLKPGMTAGVVVEVARATDVLWVPSVALRLRPSAGVLAALGESPPHSGEAPTSGTAQGGHPEPVGLNGEAAEGGDAAVWVLADGRLTHVRVRRGISDGVRTAIFSSRLEEGAAVVTGIAADTVALPAASSSPLLPSFRGRGTGAGGASPPRP